MTEVRWDEGKAYEMTLERRSDAPPAEVYGVLADLTTHLDWAGRKQHRGFRLISLDGIGPLKTGVVFTSVGTIPMARSRWENRNEVTDARPNEVLEFHTDAIVNWRSGKRTEARYEHRYRIEPDGTGARVTYRLREAAVTNPPLRMRVPLMRAMSYRMMIPYFCRRGFRNLLRSAERRETTSGVARTVRLAPTD